MTARPRVGTEELVRDIARRLGINGAEAQRVLQGVCEALREHLRDGNVVELGDVLSLALMGQPEIREDESGGFSAYAPRRRGVAAAPLGQLKSDLARSAQASVYYVSRSEGAFHELLADHFGRRGWGVLHVRNGMEALGRLDRFPPVACIFEQHVEGWIELVRELKCNPRTNWVPIVGIFPERFREAPATRLTVEPDDMIFEPFDFAEFIRTAGSDLAERVTATDHAILELQMQLPGSQRERREACRLVEEVLFRTNSPEGFCRDASAALAEALDNALRHGHCSVTCCTIAVRLLLDHKRLILAVRDSGEGFDHAAALAGARGKAGRGRSAKDPLARAAAALRTRRGEAGDGGIARLLQLADRVEYNARGNEVVLTFFRPSMDEDTSTNPAIIA